MDKDLKINTNSMESKRMKLKSPHSFFKKVKSNSSLRSSSSNLSQQNLEEFNAMYEDMESEDIGMNMEDDEGDEGDLFDEISSLSKHLKTYDAQPMKEKVMYEKKIKKKNNDETSSTSSKKNQLFQEYPSEEFIKRIIHLFIGKDTPVNKHYQFSRKMLEDKGVIVELHHMIPELKKYYLKCKHQKYLENIDSKKAITIFRQMIRLCGYTVKSVEKYQNGSKFLLYHLEQLNDVKSPRKINFEVEFD
jgi:hypothetical protein